jgi:predicted RND superfamily exporter protein
MAMMAPNCVFVPLTIKSSFFFSMQIMSIGFSVDLSAHITYAFVKAPSGLSRDAKAIAALETLGWPVFLGAFSTVVGIMVR